MTNDHCVFSLLSGKLLMSASRVDRNKRNEPFVDIKGNEIRNMCFTCLSITAKKDNIYNWPIHVHPRELL